MHNACNFHGGGNFCSASLCLEELSFQSSIQARTAMRLTPQTLEHHPIFILSLWQILILITCRWTQRTYFSCVEVHLLAWKIKLLSASHLLPLALGTLSGNLRDALIHPGRDIRLPSIAHDHLMTHTTLMIVVSLCKHSDNGSAFWSLVDGWKAGLFHKELLINPSVLIQRWYLNGGFWIQGKAAGLMEGVCHVTLAEGGRADRLSAVWAHPRVLWADSLSSVACRSAILPAASCCMPALLLSLKL